MSEAAEQKTIRNFIYMNVPVLYSIYSQIFGSITDRITEERIIQAITSNTEGIPLLPARNETQAADLSRRVESGILHDHMYNRLEDKLGESLIDVSGVEHHDLAQMLLNNPLIKVSGRTEIEDYERLREFITRFNQLGQMIAYASKSTEDGHKEKILDIVSKLAQPANAGHKKQLESELDKLTGSINEARNAGLLQDPKLMENLALLAEIFNSEGYEVAIASHDNMTRYRGIPDKNWLRMSPKLISSMYGGQSEAYWSMVGIVTHIQGTYTPPEDITLVSNPDNPMMLDAYRNMFRKSRFFERMLLESDSNTEIVISPIAIYREFSIGAK